MRVINFREFRYGASGQEPSDSASGQLFQAGGIQAARSGRNRLGMDELEAMRLTDLDGSHQADAVKMGVSRQTIGNILNSAHRKLVDALLNGKALRIGPHAAAEEAATGMQNSTSPRTIHEDMYSRCRRGRIASPDPAGVHHCRASSGV